jgi:hypothetical protein
MNKKNCQTCDGDGFFFINGEKEYCEKCGYGTNRNPIERKLKMYKTKEEYAKMILENEDIMRDLIYADSSAEYEKAIALILERYDTLRVLR